MFICLLFCYWLALKECIGFSVRVPIETTNYIPCGTKPFSSGCTLAMTTFISLWMAATLSLNDILSSLGLVGLSVSVSSLITERKTNGLLDYRIPPLTKFTTAHASFYSNIRADDLITIQVKCMYVCVCVCMGGGGGGLLLSCSNKVTFSILNETELVGIKKIFQL